MIITKHPAYGYRRIRDELKKQKIVINKKPLQKLLQIWHFQRKRKNKRPKPSSIAEHLKDLGAKANLIHRIANPHPLQILCADFTEIVSLKGTLQFIPYIDIATFRIAGWNISPHKDTHTALAAYRRAKTYLKRMKIDLSRIIIHQDQGSAFTSYEYVGTLLNDNVSVSFTENGFKDNQAMESFFGRFKEEYADLLRSTEGLSQVKCIIRKCVRDWNKNRIRSSLNGRSPDEFIHTWFWTDPQNLDTLLR